MAISYICTLPKPDDGQTSLVKNITVGSKTLTFTFQWAIVSEEQYNIIMRYIEGKAHADPLIVGDVYVRDYDPMSYYLQLRDMDEEELNTWLDTDPTLPKSISLASRASQIIMLQERIAECLALEPTIQQYEEVLRWGFAMTYEDDITVGVIEPGGWYRNQDESFSFRFISDLDIIRYDDFDKVSIEFEVYDA